VLVEEPVLLGLVDVRVRDGVTSEVPLADGVIPAEAWFEVVEALLLVLLALEEVVSVLEVEAVLDAEELADEEEVEPVPPVMANWPE